MYRKKTAGRTFRLQLRSGYPSNSTPDRVATACSEAPTTSPRRPQQGPAGRGGRQDPDAAACSLCLISGEVMMICFNFDIK